MQIVRRLLQMGMNLSNFLGYAGMEAHDLMKYAFCLVYVFDILLLRQCLQSLPESRVFSGCAAISLALIAALVWGNIQTANALYLKKDLERQATLSRMTELCLRLDQTEGYVPGETPVVFIGLPPFDTPEALAERFFAAVDMAVEDLYDATSFIVGQARAWGLDPSAVVASGSSAGAITVLQGEYERCTGSALSRRLPEGFRYAGIIAFAGAVLEKSSSGPVWREKPAPIQLFHGDADCNVPYDSIGTGGAALYGSFYLSRQFRRMNTSFYFYSVSGAAHEMAVEPMERNRAEIEIFLDRLVLGREPLMIETQVERIGTPATRKKITLSDFIRANSGA